MRQPKTKNFFLFVIVILFLANLLAWAAVYDLSRAQVLEVVFFDVGQGDSIFIETPEHHQILIDGGPSSIVLEKLGQVMSPWDRTVDLVILTHPQRDHMRGLIEVLRAYEVEHILWTGVPSESLGYREWLERLEMEGAKARIAQAGQKIRGGEVWLDILYPLERVENKKVSDVNITSVVTRLSYGDGSFLFTGDIGKRQEKELIRQDGLLKTDVLKVGHHGSKTSSSQEFLEAVAPELAVISVGQNSYGHPHREVLERLARAGIKVLRTDREGDIVILSDGQAIKILNPNDQ